MSSDLKSLAHTKWNCKYHIVFAPKYRRKVFYGEKRRAIGEILRKLCEWKGIKIVEAECCPDHIHMLLEIPPKNVCGNGDRVFERQKQFNDLRPVWESEIQISEQAILVPRVLR